VAKRPEPGTAIVADERTKHLRRLRRRRRGARRWSVLAGGFGGASAVLIPYAGLGLPDAFWAAAAGGSVVVALWRWRDFRELSALPVPPPADPALLAADLRRRLVAAVSSVPAGRTAVEELRRQRARLRFRGLAVAPAWQRLDRAAATLESLSGRLYGGPAESAILEAASAELALRDLAERAASVERALRLAPADSRDPLSAALGDLIRQFTDGVTAYEQLVAAAAGYVAEDGRSGAKYLDSATVRLTDAADLLRGVSAGLAELRGTP
jgi:hypothetical protein